MKKRIIAGTTAAVLWSVSAVTPAMAAIPLGPISVTTAGEKTFDRSVDTDEPVGVSVSVDDAAIGEVEVEVTGDVSVNYNGDSESVAGITVDANRTEHDSSVDISTGGSEKNGDIRVTTTNELSSPTGIDVTNRGDDEIDVYTGDVTVTSNSSKAATGISIANGGDGYSCVAPDAITVTGSGSGLAIGASINSISGGAKLSAYDDIEVHNPNGDATGIAQYAYNKSEDASKRPYADADVYGNVNVTSSKGQATGVSVTSIGSDLSSDTYIDGSVTASSESDQASGMVIISKAGSADALIEGNVSAKSDLDLASGMSVLALGGEVDANIWGNLSAESAGNHAAGMSLIAMGSNVSTGVSGDVTACGESASGLYLAANTGTIQSEVCGDISASGNSAIAVRATVSGADSQILLLNDGGIYAAGEEDATGIIIENDLDSNILTSDSTITIETTGLASSGTGILDLSTLSGTTTNILVDGSVYAEKGPAVAVVSGSDSNLNLTVWKLESNSDTLIAEYSKENGYQSTDASEKIAESINYILKVDENWTDSVSFTSASTKESWNGENIYAVGKEGEKVAVQLAVPDGYYVVSAYSDEAKTASLMRLASGDYYLIVPRGGGVMVSMTLAPITYANEGGGGDGNPPAGNKQDNATTGAGGIYADSNGNSFTFAEGQTSVSFSSDDLKASISGNAADLTFRTSAGQFILTASDLNELLAKYQTLRFAIRNGRLAIFADNGSEAVKTLDPAGLTV